MNRIRERPAVAPAAALERLDDPVAEEDPVRESGQAVVQGLVSDLVVEAGILEGHRCLAREHRRDLDVPRASNAPLRADVSSSVPIVVPAAMSGTIAMLRWSIDLR